MAKNNKIGLYLIGMALVAAGCFLPLTASGWGFNGSNIVDYIKDDSGDSLVTAIMILGGAIAGIVFSFVAVKYAKLVSLIVSVAGGIYVTLNIFNMNPMAKKFAHGVLKFTQVHPSWGFYLIIAGWVIAIIGYFINKD